MERPSRSVVIVRAVIVRREETVAGAADVRAVVGVIVDAAGEVDVAAVVAVTADAAGLAEEGTKNLATESHGYEEGRDSIAAPFFARYWGCATKSLRWSD